MTKKLFIDIERCYACDNCTAACGHGPKKGRLRCLALAAQELVCRRCEDAPCVKSCPQKALAKREDGMLDRYSMRCTSCKTCTIACPFGVITPEIVEYTTDRCDYGEGKAEDEKQPPCVASCPHGAIQFIEVQEDIKKNIHAVRKGKFFVHTVKWRREKHK